MTVLWRRCTRPLVQVKPEESAGDARPPLFFASIQRHSNKVIDPETGKELDVLDIAALQPIAPAGACSRATVRCTNLLLS